MVNRWYPVGCCKPKAFELGRGRQPGDPGGFEPPLPVWRKLGAGIRKPMLNAIFLVAQPAGLTLLNRRCPLARPRIHPGFLVRHPFKSPFTPISQIAEGQLFEIWEYYLILERGWVGGRLLSDYDSRRLVCLPTCTLKKCPGKTRALRAKV